MEGGEDVNAWSFASAAGPSPGVSQDGPVKLSEAADDSRVELVILDAMTTGLRPFGSGEAGAAV